MKVWLRGCLLGRDDGRGARDPRAEGGLLRGLRGRGAHARVDHAARERAPRGTPTMLRTRGS